MVFLGSQPGVAGLKEDQRRKSDAAILLPRAQAPARSEPLYVHAPQRIPSLRTVQEPASRVSR